jgi:RNA polymerase sigma-70 factor (ECF subfamily)
MYTASVASPDAHGLSPLLQGAVAGDAASLDALLAKLRPYLHALVRSRLGQQFSGGLDSSALVQECLMRVYQKINQLREPTVPHLLAWAGQIARNLVIDALRTRGHEPAKISGTRIVELLTKGLSPEQQDRRDRCSLLVAEALTQLPERRRQVIELYFLEQLSDAEICRRIGGSPGAVRVLRFRALEELRSILRACGDSDCYPVRPHEFRDGEDQ